MNAERGGNSNAERLSSASLRIPILKPKTSLGHSGDTFVDKYYLL